MYEDYAELIAILPEARPSTNGWFRLNCPFCVATYGKDDKRYSLAIREGTGSFYCNRCGERGKLNVAPEELAGRLPRVDPDKVIEAPTEMDLPSNFMPIYKEPALSAYSFRVPRNHLYDRGLIEEDWEDGRIGVVADGWFNKQRVYKRIVVPIVIRDKLMGWVARDWTDTSDRKYMNPAGMQRGEMLWRDELLDVETDVPVLVMEGVFDALPYPNAVVCFGKPSGHQKHRLLEAKRPIAICLDGDAHEEGWALAQMLHLYGKKAVNVRLPPKEDPGSVFAKDPSFLPRLVQEAFRG